MTTSPPAPRSRGLRREEVHALLQGATAALSITDVAATLGVHRNTARFHLDRLVEARRAETVEPEPEHRTPGRPPALYRAVRHMDPQGPRSYRALAGALVHAFASAPDAQARAVEAGRAWGRRTAPQTSDVVGAVAPVQRMIGLLDEMGFAPGAPADGPPAAPRTPGTTRAAPTVHPAAVSRTAVLPDRRALQIELRNCPFLELAVQRPEVVCAVHLGLMRGALESWGSAAEVTRLEPFATPETCLVHLTTPGGS